MKPLLQRVYRQTIWHPDAVEDDAFKYRNLRRIWLPLFDALSIWIGFLAVQYGSTSLNKMFPAVVVDVAGTIFTLAATVAVVGVVFPRLFLAEIVGKVVMVSLLGTYSVIVWASFLAGEVQSGFVAGMLMLPLILPFAVLQIRGEEIKQRETQAEGE